MAGRRGRNIWAAEGVFVQGVFGQPLLAALRVF